MEKIIDRDKERNQLLKHLEIDSSEIVAVYGRMRIGKTFLVRNTFKDAFAFMHTALPPADLTHSNILRAQIHHFNNSLKNYWNGYKGDDPKDWNDAFSLLSKYIGTLPKGEKLVIFLDEIPWLDSPRSYFLEAFCKFWMDISSKRNDLLVIVSGSSCLWIIDNLIEKRNGLNIEASESIFLDQFSLRECEEFEKVRGYKRSHIEILNTYMIFGGVPYYWEQLHTEIGHFTKDIDSISSIRNNGSSFRNEFSFVLSSAFRNNGIHVKIIKALSESRHFMTREQLLEKINMKSSGNVSKAIRDLESSGFISSYEVAEMHKLAYIVTDPFTIFYNEFIQWSKDTDKSSRTSDNDADRVSAWKDFSFGIACLEHLCDIKSSLLFASVETSELLFDSNSPKIGFLFHKKDRTVVLCMIRYAEQPYEMTAEEDMAIRSSSF